VTMRFGPRGPIEFGAHARIRAIQGVKLLEQLRLAMHVKSHDHEAPLTFTWKDNKGGVFQQSVDIRFI